MKMLGCEMIDKILILCQALRLVPKENYRKEP